MVAEFDIPSALKDLETIAGGRRVYIRRYLEHTYGRGRWRKMKGIATLRLPDGTIYDLRSGESLV